MNKPTYLVTLQFLPYGGDNDRLVSYPNDSLEELFSWAIFQALEHKRRAEVSVFRQED